MIHYGHVACAVVEDREGITLNDAQRRIVMLEGYADQPYLCTAGELTCGVGQTGPWLKKPFIDAYEHHVDRVKTRIPTFSTMPHWLQGELVQAEYRGDLGISPKTVKLINSGNFEEASLEYLDHDEYREGPTQIKRRIAALSLALQLYGHILFP